MSTPFNIVAVNGSLNVTSRTRVLLDALVTALSTRVAVTAEVIEVQALAAHVGPATRPEQLDAIGLAALRSIERADLLIIGTPVYKGSYTGLLKHLLDFVHPEALVGRPVLLAATGASDRHALVVDHQLRPLFSFFRTLTVPTAVYASDANYDGLALQGDALVARIGEAASQAASLLQRGGVAPHAPLRQAA